MEDSNQTNLGTLFEESRFKIPNYQRSYSWEEEQIVDFLDDLEYTRGKDGSEHYFGTIVVEGIDELDWYSKDVDEFNIVDGQQRIITASIFYRCLINELKSIKSLKENRSKDFGNTSKHTIENFENTFLYFKEKEKRRILPETLAGEVYEKTVIENESSDSLPQYFIDCLPARRIINARKIISERINTWRLDVSEDTNLGQFDNESLENYKDYLISLGNTLSSDFNVTVTEVGDSNEAARMFKVINDRGKNLTFPDRIKSHLTYCASQNEGIEVKEVQSKINESIENITSYKDTDEKTINQFFRVHWCIFSSEYKSKVKGSDPYESMTNQSKHVSDPNRPNIDLWIDEYIDSLCQLSKSYVEIKNPTVYKNTYDGKEHKTINDMLYIVKRNNSDYISLILSSREIMGKTSHDFLKLTSLLESYLLRYREVMKNSPTIDRLVGTSAHKLYWTNKEEEHINKVFNNDYVLDNHPSSVSEIHSELSEALQEKISQQCDEETFGDYLTEKDVFDGDGRDNWRGFRSKTIIKYILYEYEKHLREDTTQTRLDQLPELKEIIADYEIEHIAPKNPRDGEALGPGHRKNVNKIGNLGLWKPKDNKTSSNASFEDKRGKYNNSGMEILQKVAEENESWDIQDVKDRSQSIKEFCQDRWSITWDAELVYI